MNSILHSNSANSRKKNSNTCIGRARPLALMVCALLLLILMVVPAFAQAVPYTVVNANYPGTGGTFSYNGAASPTPTFTVAGSGGGFGPTANDQYGMALTPAAGNIELRGRLVSQSSGSSGAFAGLILRESGASSAAMGSVGVTVAGNIMFAYRTSTGEWVTTNTGAAVSLPLYLKLVRNGTKIEGFYSADNESWTSAGSNTATNVMPNKFYAGFVAFSTTGSLNTAVFDYVTFMSSVPQVTSDMLLWTRADSGVVSSSGAVSTWTDMSTNAKDATQSTSANKPTLMTGAVNNAVAPVITFDGTNDNLSMGSDFADLSAGFSTFIVTKPGTGSGTHDLLALGNTSNNDAVIVEQTGTNVSFIAYNGATSSSVTTSSTPLSTSQYKLVEAVLQPGASTGTASGTIYVNGTQEAQSTSLQNLANTTRGSNVISSSIASTNFFNGDIAEVIVLKRPVTDSERKSYESYFLSKYGIGATPTLSNPSFFPASGAILTPGSTVSLSQDQSAVTFFTQDGTTPGDNVNSIWYNQTPLTITKNTQLKSIAVAPFFNDSSVATSNYMVDANTIPVPRSGLVLWLRGDANITTSSGNVTDWGDASGLGNNATQSSSSNRPAFVDSAINGLPAVSFTSSDFLQLPSDFASLSGASVFAVVNPTSVSGNERIIDLGNGTASDNLQLQLPSSTSVAFYAYNGSTSSSVTASSSIALNKFQLVEVIHDGAAKATLAVDAEDKAQNTSMQNFNNVTRTSNFVGQASGGGSYFVGELAELLVFNRGVSSAERAAIEGYLLSRYQFDKSNAPAAPIISLPTSTLSAPSQVAISASGEATIYVTTDGTVPTTASPVYSGPVNVLYSQTVKSIAVVNGVSSGVSSATYTLDSTRWPAPGSTSTPLQLEIQTPQLSIPQDANQH